MSPTSHTAQHSAATDALKSPSPKIEPSPPSSTAGPDAPTSGSSSQNALISALSRYESFLDRKFGVEAQGPERVLPHERNPPRTWVMAALWASATMNLSCFATGFLGWQFGMGLRDSILVIVFGTFLGAAVTGWCATLGPPTGLRQVSVARYSLGWYPSKIIAVLNIISQLGWSAVGCITGGLALTAVSSGHVSLALGVVIVAVVGLLISFIGLRAVFRYEQFAWMVFLVIFIIMYAMAAPRADASNPGSLAPGRETSGAVLSLLGVVYGSSASWCGIVGDYYVVYPVNTKSWKVFTLTWLGIAVPTCLGMIIGACVASTIGIDEDWAAAYDMGLGYLIREILHPKGFADFILVLLVLSGIGTNCLSIYSAALNFQQFSRPLSALPRSLWTLPVFLAILLLALLGRDSLLTVLQNFLSLLGYWNTAFFAILFFEHYVFRKGSIENYDLEAWNSPRRLPLGLAGLLAFLTGIAGAVISMGQTWYTGPVIRAGWEGLGDLGNELCFGMTVLVYLPARWFEIRVLERKRLARVGGRM